MSSIEGLIKKLRSVGGKEFEKAVADAFRFLHFDVDVIEETQAESDIIVKAPIAMKPYFVVVECNAVREGEQVSYTKLGQIRGNFVKYVTSYGQRFSSSYIMIVGRPSFSPDAKKLAYDTVLLTVDGLVKLLENHRDFRFSQDELEIIFREGGEVEIELFLHAYYEKLNLYALIYMSLLKDPTSSKPERKTEWMPIQRLIGSIERMAWILKLEPINETEVVNAVRDLSNPFLKMIEIKGGTVALSGLPLNVIKANMGRLGVVFHKTLTDFVERIKHLRQP